MFMTILLGHHELPNTVYNMKNNDNQPVLIIVYIVKEQIGE